MLPFKKIEQTGMSRDYWTVKWSNKENYKSGEENRIHIHMVNEQTGYLQGVFI